MRNKKSPTKKKDAALPLALKSPQPIAGFQDSAGRFHATADAALHANAEMALEKELLRFHYRNLEGIDVPGFTRFVSRHKPYFRSIIDSLREAEDEDCD